MVEIEGPLGTVVDELYRDGVVKGRVEAERLIAEAKEVASSIVDHAKEEAALIVSQARETAMTESAKIRNELDLAARDAMIELQQVLAKALVSLLRPQVTRLMSDEHFVAGIVENLFADTWSDQQAKHELHMSELYHSGLFDHLLSRMTTTADQKSAVIFDLHKNGFEYRIDDSIVEITDESVLELLHRYVSERTHEHLARLSKHSG